MPPSQRKHLSTGVVHVPDRTWKASALAAAPFNLMISSQRPMMASMIA
jgi:hypothetical protein